ncbi:hypothetical protein ACHAXR_009130 [Thalassiosira sp. AJA248-18]
MMESCQHCGIKPTSTNRIRACTRCFSVGYCSKACQRASWSGRDGHKKHCRPRPATSVVDSPIEENDVVRLEVKRGDGNNDDNEVWEDVGPINMSIGDMASAAINSSHNSMGDNHTTPPLPNNNAFTKPNLIKEIPATTHKILGPESPNKKYKYRHSPDGVDENLLIFFHGAGDNYHPFDALGKQMELPQTAILSISASISLKLPYNKGSRNGSSSKFVELPFGLGNTWFEEMDYECTGETLPKDHPRRLKSLKHAVELLGILVCSLAGIDSANDDARLDAAWIPERIFLFGFSAGSSLVMEFCRMWMNAGRVPLGGAICIAGGIQTKDELPGMKQEEVGSSTRQKNQPTDVLIITGSKDSIYSKEAATLSRQLYHPSKVQVHIQKGKGHTMIKSKEEMQVIMEFLSKRLVRRMISMEGQCQKQQQL